MPALDGFQPVKILRETPRLSSIPSLLPPKPTKPARPMPLSWGKRLFAQALQYGYRPASGRDVTARNAIQTLEREKRMLSKMSSWRWKQSWTP
jgi:hypothetical protein